LKMHSHLQGDYKQNAQLLFPFRKGKI
jgi:hypothetical protein